MTRKEMADAFVLRIERERVSLGLTQEKMAEKLEMSPSGYKKMVAGITSKIDLYIAYQMQMLTGKSFLDFSENPTEQLKLMTMLYQLNDTQIRFIKGIIAYELAFQDKEDNTDPEDYVSLLTLTGNHEDGMIWDSFNTEKLNVASYRKRFGSDLHCALRINSNFLHPVYHSGDILLISQTAPRDGDTAIFTDREIGRTYLRRLRKTNLYRLETLNNLGRPITIDLQNQRDINKWIVFGKVLSKMRR